MDIDTWCYVLLCGVLWCIGGGEREKRGERRRTQREKGRRRMACFGHKPLNIALLELKPSSNDSLGPSGHYGMVIIGVLLV